MFKKIFKFILALTLFSLIIFSIIEVNSQNVVSVLKNLLKNNSLKAQEIKLKLIFLFIMPVGKAKISNLGIEKFRNQDLLHIRAEAKTLEYLSGIFNASAVVDSYIEPKKLYSLYFLQHLKMVNKPVDEREIAYDQKKHVMTYKGRRGTEERIVDENAQDPLSAIFYIQNQAFQVGKEFKLSMNTNQKNYILAGKCLSKETLKIGNVDYDIWLINFNVARKDKNPRHKTSFRVWFVNKDKTKIPILIKAMTNIGPIIARAQ